jgi:hypothetical protein
MLGAAAWFAVHFGVTRRGDASLDRRDVERGNRGIAAVLGSGLALDQGKDRVSDFVYLLKIQ